MKIGALKNPLLLLGLAAMLGCGDSSNDTVVNTNNTGGNNQSIAPYAVYTMTNTNISNSIREYQRDVNGALTFVGDFTTGGNGDSSDLEGATGSLIFQSNANRFFAVNAGSNTISAMVLGTDGVITVISTVTSNGQRPVSITAYNDSVYVLNYGDAALNIPANITGYTLNGTQLVPIPNSTQLLSTAHPDPAQIGFHPTGTVLVVTERGTNNIETFQIGANGAALPGVAQGSNGTTPGGFDFNPNGLLIVAEANNDNAGAGSSSTYIVGQDGTLTDLSVSIGNGQTGTAAAKIYANAPYVFYTNTISDTISAYTLDANGGLVLQGGGVAQNTGDNPTDLGVSADGSFVYTLNTADDSLSTFRINPNATLTPVNGTLGLPPAAVGLVVR